MEEKIKATLESLRPALQAHGGGVEFVDWNESKKQVRLALTGHCVGCMYSQMTLKNGIEQALKDEVDKDIEVINVNIG